MGTISKNTAIQIALAYQEVERGEGLLADVKSAIEARKDDFTDKDRDLRDVFGHQHRALQIGIPSGSNGHRLMGVSYDLAVPVIEAHIANQRAQISALSALAKAELEAS